MAITGVGVIVQEAEPGSAPNGSAHVYSAWFKPSVQKWYINSDWGWVEVSELDVVTSVILAAAIANLSSIYAAIDHSHPTHGDINFTGTVSSGGEAGIDSSGEGEFQVGQIESIKVRNGLIVALTEK